MYSCIANCVPTNYYNFIGIRKLSYAYSSNNPLSYNGYSNRPIKFFLYAPALIITAESCQFCRQ